MKEITSEKFLSIFAKMFEEFCNGFLDFDKTVIVNGHLFISVDDSKSVKFMVNEKGCKTDNAIVSYLSNSYATTEQQEVNVRPFNAAHFSKQSDIVKTVQMDLQRYPLAAELKYNDFQNVLTSNCLEKQNKFDVSKLLNQDGLLLPVKQEILESSLEFMSNKCSLFMEKGNYQDIGFVVSLNFI